MALNKKSIIVDQDQLATEMNTTEEYNGTSPEYMPIPFQKRGVEANNEIVNTDTLKTHIAQEELVILYIFYDSDLTDFHFALAVGYTPDTIYVHDPWPTSWPQPTSRTTGANVSLSNSLFDTLKSEGNGTYALVVSGARLWWLQDWFVITTIAIASTSAIVVTVIIVRRRKNMPEQTEIENVPPRSNIHNLSS
jgi:hypothetical protein